MEPGISQTKKRIEARLQEIEREARELRHAIDIFNKFSDPEIGGLQKKVSSTLQSRVFDVLKKSQQDMLSANEILEKISDTSRESLAATLSRMKIKGLIKNEKKKWGLIKTGSLLVGD